MTTQYYETYNRTNFKEDVRTHYAWPGGYEIFLLTNDGSLICNDCAKANAREILTAMRDPRDSSGWRVIGNVTEDTMEDDDYCAQCNKQLHERTDPDDWHDDLVSTDGINWYQSGKLMVTIDPDGDRNAQLRAYCNAQQYWPDIWLISDHGNATRISKDVYTEQ